MPEDLLNQQAGTAHEPTAHAEDDGIKGKPSADPARAGTGTEASAELMAQQADAIRAQVVGRSAEDFMQRLAARIAAEARRPSRVQYASVAIGDPGLQPYGEEPAELTQLAPPPTGPAPHTVRPGASTRPRVRRGGRRRPEPIITTDPGAGQYMAFSYVTQLCSTVLRSGEIDTLAAFAADYDEAGARTFGCLLYSLDKRESALYWWRFAAGAGDALAAHLLAAHHAAIGPTTEARAWRAIAQILAFTPEHHVPEPVRPRTELAEGFARELPMRDEMRLFMRYPHLPKALAAQ